MLFKKLGQQEFSKFSQRNGKLKLSQWKQANYPLIPIYATMVILQEWRQDLL